MSENGNVSLFVGPEEKDLLTVLPQENQKGDNGGNPGRPLLTAIAAGVFAETGRGRSICLEIRAAGHGDGFRSGEGEQVPKARGGARTAQTTIC
jgi:hypothetical protein